MLKERIYFLVFSAHRTDNMSDIYQKRDCREVLISKPRRRGATKRRTPVCYTSGHSPDVVRPSCDHGHISWSKYERTTGFREHVSPDDTSGINLRLHIRGPNTSVSVWKTFVRHYSPGSFSSVNGFVPSDTFSQKPTCLAKVSTKSS